MQFDLSEFCFLWTASPLKQVNQVSGRTSALPATFKQAAKLARISTSGKVKNAFTTGF
jgi:hypothetical protein